MKTFCHRCGEQKPTVLYAEIRECCVCGAMWEDHEKPETTALRNKIRRHADDLALHVSQYNAGVEAAKSGKVVGPRPEFDTSTYYDGYAATMFPALQARVAELEEALRNISHGPVGYWNEPQHREETIQYMMQVAHNALKGGE
jgi:hypothetical protein